VNRLKKAAVENKKMTPFKRKQTVHNRRTTFPEIHSFHSTAIGENLTFSSRRRNFSTEDSVFELDRRRHEPCKSGN
jgi:hypothetical protein